MINSEFQDFYHLIMLNDKNPETLDFDSTRCEKNSVKKVVLHKTKRMQ